MKNRLLAVYLLFLGLLALAFVAADLTYYVKRALSDESRLKFYSSTLDGNVAEDIVLVNAAWHPRDSIRTAIRYILKQQPKVVMIDLFYDSTDASEKSDGLLILGASEDDEGHYRYSENVFTTNQKHGDISLSDYFRIDKFYHFGFERIPRIEMAILEEFDPNLYAELKKSDDAEIASYLPLENFMILELDDVKTQSAIAAGEGDNFMKDNIVIVGFLGESGEHAPKFLEWEDVHHTPIGPMFGCLVIANRLHALMTNRISSLGTTVLFLISCGLLAGSFFASAAIPIKRKISLILVVNGLLGAVLFILAFATINLLAHQNYFISIELPAIGLVCGSQGGIIYKLMQR